MSCLSSCFIQRTMMRSLVQGGDAMVVCGTLDLHEVYDDDENLPPGYIGDEVYRCPVSTPTVSRRPGSNGQRSLQPFITFTSMNRSLNMPTNISEPKHNLYKQYKRPVAKAQRKNFDCYFVNRNVRPAQFDAKTKATWLNTLCAQPVSEIFGKYKRRSEASRQEFNPKLRNSTPGEKALVSGWSSNASSRGSPTRSRSTRSLTSHSHNSQVSSMDPNQRVVVFEGDSTKYGQPGLALLPYATTSTTYDGETESMSPRSSPLFQKVFRSAGPQSNVIPLHGVVSSSTSVDSSIYEPFQRDKRFPDIRARKATFSPKRKVVPSHGKHTPTDMTSPSATQELQESPIHIVSIEKLSTTPRSGAKNVRRITFSGKCSYRLPKQNLSKALPVLESTV